MDHVASLSPLQRIMRLICIGAVLLSAVMLSGCTRPNDDNITFLLNKQYDCKGLVVEDMVKTDSLPGIFTYVAQYNFLVKLKYGEEDAIPFYNHLIRLANIKGKAWQAGIYAPKLQDYLLDECTENGQTVVETMLEDVLRQLAANEKDIKLPIAVEMTGWSEFMPSSNKEGGWNMTIRRDRFGDKMAYSKPVSRKVLLRGTGKR